MPAEIESTISELDIIENVRVIGVPSDFYGEEVAACADCLKKDRKAGRASEHKELEFLICFLEHRLG